MPGSDVASTSSAPSPGLRFSLALWPPLTLTREPDFSAPTGARVSRPAHLDPFRGASPLRVGVLGPSVGLCPTFPKYVRVREGRGAHVCPSWRAKGWDLSRPHHMFICEVPVHGFHCGSRPDLADFVVRWARDAARHRRRMRSSASAVGVAVGVVREYRPAHGPGQVT
jgi:hypothetical protein